MSEHETFLARWTRRKRDAATSPAEAPRSQREAGEIAQTTPETTDIAPTAGAPTSQTETPAPAPAFDPESLPPLETITAQSDIRAFLGPGVPAELTRAALRRAWSADPAIRDFIGIAENQWDFTASDAMPGFGPLADSDEVRKIVARVFGELTEADTPAPEPKSEQPADPPLTSIDEMTAAPSLPPLPSSQTDRPTEEVMPTIVQRDEDNTATQYSQASDGNLDTPRPRPHGGALPR